MDLFIPIGDVAIFKFDGVQHAIAVKCVVSPIGLKIGVGAIANIKTIEVFGNLANDLHVREGVLSLNGCIVAA